MKKKSLLANLQTSVEKQAVQTRDKFDIADLTMAIKRAAGTPHHEVIRDEKSSSKDISPNLEKTVETNTKESPERTLITLPIAEVHDHPRNARHLYDPTRIDEMAASIARDGQMVPVIVMRHPELNEQYLLIEGRYRKRALQSLGRETIQAIVVDPMSDLEAYRLSLILNEERNQQTDLDNAISWKMLQSDGLFTSQEHIAEYLGITQSKVSKTLSLLDLPASIIAIMKTNPSEFGLRIGYELRQLSRQYAVAELETIAEQVRDGKLTVAALEKMRISAQKPIVTRERSRAYTLRAGETAVGTLREFEDGRLKMELTGISAQLRQEVIISMQKLLDANTAHLNER